MNPVTFGIVGGYGATGRMIASELWKSGDGTIFIGGRNLEKARALATEFDGRVSAVQVDALDDRSLNQFCSRCSIVINCAAPVSLTQDRVAQAALQQRCHYIDPGGFSFIKQRLLPHSREIEDSHLSFVLSAGWLPGLSEVLPLYADAEARSRMDAIESVSLYFGDCSEWSTTALRDAVWYIRQFGLRSPGYFRGGKWTRILPLRAYRTIDLGSPIGIRRFYTCSTPELDDPGRRLSHCDFFSHSYISGFRVVIAGALVALLPLPEAFAIRLVRNVFRSASLPVGGFIEARVVGRSQGRKEMFGVRMTYDKHRQYWANALPPAVTARMLAQGGGVHPGVHFLAEAVDPIAFMAEMQKAGLGPRESLEAREGGAASASS